MVFYVRVVVLIVLDTLHKLASLGTGNVIIEAINSHDVCDVITTLRLNTSYVQLISLLIN